MKIGKDNYKFGTKNNWRRWQYNRILEKLDKPAKEALVLYLVGPKDIDREIMINKGFKNNNLIAIDINNINIKNVTNKKGLGICHNLRHIIAAWDKEPKIDVIIADFCCGITKEIMQFCTTLNLTNGMNEGCVIAINLLRGRDPISNKFRNWIDHEYKKHRGKHFFNWFVNFQIAKEFNIMEYRKNNIGNGVIETNKVLDIDPVKQSFGEGVLNYIINLYYKDAKPSFNTYKSTNGPTVMDSCVFKLKTYKEYTGEMQAFDPTNEKIKIAKRKIAAVKAWRTMRMADNPACKQ